MEGLQIMPALPHQFLLPLLASPPACPAQFFLSLATAIKALEQLVFQIPLSLTPFPSPAFSCF